MVDIDKIGSGGADYGPEISELSADKRDYDDLTYNLTSTSVVVEQFDPSKMDSDQVSAVNAYRSGM